MKIDRFPKNGTKKSHNFATNRPKMAEKSVKMIFPDHSVNIKVVDNDESYLNMQF